MKARHHGRSLMRRARARHWQRNTRRAVCIWRRWTRDRLRYKDANLVAASLQRAHLARRVWDALRSHVTEVLHHRSQLQHAHMYWRYKVLRRVLRGVRRFCIYSRQVRPTPRPPNPACRPGVRANASLRSCVWLCVCACACACACGVVSCVAGHGLNLRRTAQRCSADGAAASGGACKADGDQRVARRGAHQGHAAPTAQACEARVSPRHAAVVHVRVGCCLCPTQAETQGCRAAAAVVAWCSDAACDGRVGGPHGRGCTA